MSWLAPDDFAQDLLTGTASDVLQLAKYSALAPRIEPLLLRNMRVKFLPGSEPDLEHRLWFSNLVSARSTKNIVLDQGIARLLADQLTTDSDLLAQVWRYTQVCTAHWSGLDKLEQQLRYDCLLNDHNAINQGLQAVLSKISKTQDEDERLTLARWAKKTLPAISSASAPSDEIAWLAQYAATALGATAAWTTLSFAKPMPGWLSSVLPAVFAKTQIGLQLRYDTGADHQVLACLPPEQSDSVLDLPTPLPARLYVRTDSESAGRWLVVNVGSLIKIPNNAKTIELRTIDGKGYQLQVNLSSPLEPENTVTPVSFYLIHGREDAETARQIAEQLQKFFDLHINLIAEQPGETAIESQPGQHSKVLRLWTPNAQRQWARMELEPSDGMGNSLLLRLNQAELPKGTSSAQVLDLSDTASLLKGIQQWLDNSNNPAAFEPESAETDSSPQAIKEPESPPKPTLKIYLSYALEDYEKVRKLALALEKQGWPVFLDQSAILPGQHFSETIEQEIKKADCMIIAWSSFSAKSKWVRKEIVSNALEKTMLVVEFEPNSRFPISSQGLFREDFSSWNGDPNYSGFKRLCESLDYIQKSKETIKPAASTQPFLEPNMVIIPAGWFLMGGKNKTEQPLHTVTITKPFALGKYPVTFAEYDLFAEATSKTKPEDGDWGRENRPVINVSWHDAMAYAEWLSRLTGKHYRLPSEAEWEYAARAAPNTESQADYYWGKDNAQDYAWYLENSKSQTHPVGQLKPNAFGLYDMSGNVWEWVQDQYSFSAHASDDGSAWEQGLDDSSRILRGGSYSDPLYDLTSGVSSASSSTPNTRYKYIGFRLARDLP
jgi:formylglycine-generating enzyme required for sulfatase activity